MKTVLTATNKEELEQMAADAYAGTKEADGMHRGFSASEIQTEEGKIECRATPCQSTRTTAGWFSFRYYINGTAIKKCNITKQQAQQ